MGWTTIRGATKADIIKERIEDKQYCLNPAFDENGKMRIDPNRRAVSLAHRCIGAELYIVWSIQTRNNESEKFVEVNRFIEIDFVEKHNGDYGYKDMDEGSEPWANRCPLAFLAMVPEDKYPTSVNLAWRATVRAYHARPQYIKGDTLVFDPPIKASVEIAEMLCLDKQKHIFDIKGVGLRRISVSWLTGTYPFTIRSSSQK